MPAKKNTADAKEMKRRKEQSRRDKLIHAGGTQNKVSKAKMKIQLSQNPRGSLQKRVAEKMGSFNQLNLLAQTMVAPRDKPPLRLPEQQRKRTDVKHLWMTDTLSLLYPLSPPSAVAMSTATFFGKSLAPDEGFMVLLRNPVCPAIYPVSTAAATNVYSKYAWHLTGDDGTAGPRPNATTLVIVPFGSVSTPTSATFPPQIDFTPRGPASLLAPYQAVALTGTNLQSFRGTDVIPGWQDKYSNYWNFYGGGVMSVVFTHLDGNNSNYDVPAGGGILIRWALQRYNGTNDPDDYNLGTVTIKAGTSSAEHTVNGPGTTATNTNLGQLSAGYYRFIIHHVGYNPGTEAIIYGALVGEAFTTIPPTNTVAGVTDKYGPRPEYMVIAPVNNVVTEAPYMLENTRVTSHAALLTNTSPKFFRGGTILGARLQTGVNGAGWWDHTLSQIQTAAGHSTYGYRGDLANGAYTWMPLPDDVWDMQQYLGRQSKTGITADEVARTYPRIPIDHEYGCHVIYWNAPGEGTALGSTSDLSLLLRIDTHVEFISSSQLADLKVSIIGTDALTHATIALAAAPLFTENWTHLNELWGKIKAAGLRVATAGGKALASAAMSELAAGLAVMAI